MYNWTLLVSLLHIYEKSCKSHKRESWLFLPLPQKKWTKNATLCRFLRTKKDRDRYKFKQEEIIGNVIEGKVNDRRESKTNSGDIGYLSYGTV